jgi:hypothetical protein
VLVYPKQGSSHLYSPIRATLFEGDLSGVYSR